MKAKLTSTEESQKFTLEIPMEEFLDLVLGEEQRNQYRDCSFDIWGDSRQHTETDEPDKAITITFYKSREWRANADGVLELAPKNKPDPLVRRSEIEKILAELEGEHRGS